MKDRARVEHGLALAKELLNLQQLAVFQHRLQGRYLGIDAQDEDAVEPRLLGKFAGIDLECVLALRLAALAKVAPVGGVADQRLLAASQSVLQGSDDRLAIQPVLLGFRFVAADDVTPPVDLYLLDEELRLSSRTLDQQRHKGSLVLQHDPLGDPLGALACTQNIVEPTLLEPANRCCRDHAAIGNDAHPAKSRRRSNSRSSISSFTHRGASAS